MPYLGDHWRRPLPSETEQDQGPETDFILEEELKLDCERIAEECLLLLQDYLAMLSEKEHITGGIEIRSRVAMTIGATILNIAGSIFGVLTSCIGLMYSRAFAQKCTEILHDKAIESQFERLDTVIGTINFIVADSPETAVHFQSAGLVFSGGEKGGMVVDLEETVHFQNLIRGH